jgi:hypothetical protein
MLPFGLPKRINDPRPIHFNPKYGSCLDRPDTARGRADTLRPPIWPTCQSKLHSSSLSAPSLSRETTATRSQLRPPPPPPRAQAAADLQDPITAAQDPAAAAQDMASMLHPCRNRGAAAPSRPSQNSPNRCAALAGVEVPPLPDSRPP